MKIIFSRCALIKIFNYNPKFVFKVKVADFCILFVYTPVICFHDEGCPLAGGLAFLVVDVHLRDGVKVNAPLRLALRKCSLN